MFRLFTLLSTYRNLLVFLLLEGLALMFIVRNNDYQRHQVGDTALELSGRFNESTSKLWGFFNLQTQNDTLIQKNIALSKETQRLRLKIDRYEGMLARDSVSYFASDTVGLNEAYQFFPARVIRNSTNLNYNYITLDKGSDDGVKEGMGVVSPQGIVGNVIKTRPRYSLVISALNVSAHFLVKVVRPNESASNGHVGIYEWEGGDPFEANLTYIPETVEIFEGDWVLSSGYRSVFPAGYLVGKVVSIEKAKDGYHDAKIALATDFHALGNVYLVASQNKAELDSLELSVPR